MLLIMRLRHLRRRDVKFVYDTCACDVFAAKRLACGCRQLHSGMMPHSGRLQARVRLFCNCCYEHSAVQLIASVSSGVTPQYTSMCETSCVSIEAYLVRDFCTYLLDPSNAHHMCSRTDRLRMSRYPPKAGLTMYKYL